MPHACNTLESSLSKLEQLLSDGRLYATTLIFETVKGKEMDYGTMVQTLEERVRRGAVEKIALKGRGFGWRKVKYTL